MTELKHRIEAILFASGKGVSENDLADYCDSKLNTVKKALKELQDDYKKKDSSLVINDVEDKWKLTVKGKYTEDVQKIVSETELPRPVLKTLAVVAYKSPIMQSEVINMRGQGAYEHIKILNKQKLITKEEHGRSYILKITDKFYNYFDVEGDEDIKELFEKLRETHDKKLGELEVIELEKNNSEENKETIGNLEVVEIEPSTAKKTPEEEKEEENFLKRFDEEIETISKRVDTHELPKRHTHPELEKEQKTIDDTTTNIEDVKKSMNEEREKEKKNEEKPLEEIEKFVEKQSKEEEEENYI